MCVNAVDRNLEELDLASVGLRGQFNDGVERDLHVGKFHWKYEKYLLNVFINQVSYYGFTARLVIK